MKEPQKETESVTRKIILEVLREWAKPASGMELHVTRMVLQDRVRVRVGARAFDNDLFWGSIRQLETEGILIPLRPDETWKVNVSAL